MATSANDSDPARSTAARMNTPSEETGGSDSDEMETARAAAIAEAFRGARNGDAETARSAAASSSSSSSSDDLPRFHAVPKPWMDDFLSWIRPADDGGGADAERPGEIECAELIVEGGERTGGGGGANGGASSAVTTAPASGLLGDDDDDENVRQRLERRRRWQQRGQNRPPSLKPGLAHGRDFVMVGSHVWTLLSEKFGYDVPVSIPSAPLPSDGGAASRLAVELRAGGASAERILPVPASGRWSYGEVDDDGDIDIVDADADVDAASDTAMAAGDEDSKLTDLFPDVDETDTFKVSSDGASSAVERQQPPVILLPPPSSSQSSAAKSTGHQLAMVSLDERSSGGDGEEDCGADPAVQTRMDCGDGGAAAAGASRKRADKSSGSSSSSSSSAPSVKRKRIAAGLGNLGNTCFMNSTLQCLAHTGPLRRYFVSGDYETDLNRGNPLGTGGELATEFAKLLCQMWGLGGDSGGGGGGGGAVSYRGSSLYSTSGSYDSGSSSVVYPRDFKYTLGRHASQFVGYDQHDSQELATFLIDALHEDTNRVTSKPYVEKPEQGEEESDDDAATKAWDLHLKREDSRVLESFMGQVKSRVQCPRGECGRVSTTFDPFIFLSVPIPGATDRTLSVTYVPLDPNERMKTLRVTLSKTSTVKAMQRRVVEMINESYSLEGTGGEAAVGIDDVKLVDVWNHEVYTWYGPDEDIDKIRDTDLTYAYQLASKAEIRAETERSESAKGAAADTDEADAAPKPKKRRPRTKLDVATLTRLNQNWEDALAKYLAQPLTLTTMMNPSRTTHEERLAFHAKLDRFIGNLRRCPDSVPKGAADRPVTDADFDDSNSDDDGSNPAASDDDDYVDDIDDIDPDGMSLEERCHTNAHFRNVRTPTDLAALEFCAKKFRAAALDLADQKENKYRDGVVVQVLFKRHEPPVVRGSAMSLSNRHSGVTVEKSFGVPLVLRVGPNTTVHGLRQLVGRRLRRAVKCHGAKEEQAEAVDVGGGDDDAEIDALYGDGNESMPKEGGGPEGGDPPALSEDEMGGGKEENADGGDGNVNSGGGGGGGGGESSIPLETSLLCQVAMTYERKSSSSYKSHSSYRKLGALLKSDDMGGDLGASRKLSYATPSDEGERDVVADLVGPEGTVQLHWPVTLASECFDDEEWEKAEALPSAKAADDEVDAAAGGTEKPKQVNVSDCISKYCQIEQLEESEMWYCNRCKDHVRAWKQFHLYRAPPVLIVHLKRFHYSASTHRRDKIDSFIDFPLRGLDLTGEVMHWEEGGEPLYDCYAVSNHYGGLGGGHYTAYAVNEEGDWCHFDDSRVTTGVSEDEVKSAAAYVLYYIRRDVAMTTEDEASEEEDGDGGNTTSSSEAASDGGALNLDGKVSDEDMDVDGNGEGGDSSQTCSSPMESIEGEEEEVDMTEMESLVVQSDDNPQEQ